MFVTTAIVGERSRKVPSLSSASATRSSPWPSRAFEPSARSLPPTTTVGSSPASREHRGDERRGRGLAVRAGDRDAVLHAHQLGEHLGARDHRDLQLAGASTSGFEIFTADEITTTSTSAVTCSARWPTTIVGAEAREPARRLGLGEVGAGDA